MDEEHPRSPLAAIEHKSVRHFFLLGLEVSERVRIWHAFTGELRNHLDAIFRQSSTFARIVRQQTNFLMPRSRTIVG